MKHWKVALYARVSTDKEEQRDSIPAQLQSLEEWVTRRSKEDTDSRYTVVKTYEDWGRSGSDFDRESFQAMKRDIEAGLVNMVLTRDLSRFGRNYILAGYYLEDYFRVNGVRFVSVLDQVDTVEEIGDIVPFRNILNEMYIKDCSRRSRDGLKQRMARGSYIGSRAPYGYKREQSFAGGQKTISLVPSGDESTETVRRIFALYLLGWGYSRIAACLNKEGIASPGGAAGRSRQKYGGWSENTVKAILRNPKYAGRMVQGQNRKISYKLDKTVRTEEKDWIDGGSFEGIIPEEVLEQVKLQMSRRAGGYRYKKNNIHLFSGVLVCGDCGGPLCYRTEYRGYKCLNSQRGGGRCTPHSVKEQFLMDTVAGDLRELAEAIDRDRLFESLRDLTGKDRREAGKRLKELEAELRRLEDKLAGVYDDRLEGIITSGDFGLLSERMLSKQARLLADRKALQAKLAEALPLEEEYEGLRQRIHGLLSFDELIRRRVEELVDRITVSEDKATREKSIEISYRFMPPEKPPIS